MPTDEHKRVVRFGIVGVAGSGLSVGLFALIVGPVGWDHRVAATLATTIALCTTFLVNRRWTFEADHLHAGHQAWKFAVVSGVAIAVNVLVVMLLVDAIGTAKVLGEVVAVCCQAPVSYVGNRLWTFAEPAVVGEL